jgi:predicted secreted protein
MKRRILALAGSFLFPVCLAFSGDVSSFVNLGFSADSRYFMFGQYGVEQATGKQFSEVGLVDLAKNDFVPQGQRKALYDAKVELGQNGSGAFHALFAETIPDAKKYGVDFLSQGRLMYVLMNGDAPAEKLEFRDFKSEKSYAVALSKKITVSEKTKAYSSSFSIAVGSTDPAGKKAEAKGGTPAFVRDNVKDYVIRQILASPDEKYLVVVIEKIIADKNGDSIKYMIEAIKLP